MYDGLGHVWLEQFGEDLNGLGMLVVTDLGDEITFVCSPSWLIGPTSGFWCQGLILAWMGFLISLSSCMGLMSFNCCGSNM